MATKTIKGKTYHRGMAYRTKHAAEKNAAILRKHGAPTEVVCERGEHVLYSHLGRLHTQQQRTKRTGPRITPRTPRLR